MPEIAGWPRLLSWVKNVSFSVEETCTQSCCFATRRPVSSTPSTADSLNPSLMINSGPINSPAHPFSSVASVPGERGQAKRSLIASAHLS